MIIENQKIESGFIEREINFSLKSGLKIDIKSKNCHINCFMNIENKFFYPIANNRFPPIDIVIKTLILTTDIDYENDEIMGLIEHVDLHENPDYRFVLEKKDVTEQFKPSCNVHIKIPEELREIPAEAQIAFPDGACATITKSTQNFYWIKDNLACLLAAGIGTYRMRMRARIDDEVTPWSNFISFKLKGKRTIGRTFKKH